MSPEQLHRQPIPIKGIAAPHGQLGTPAEWRECRRDSAPEPSRLVERIRLEGQASFDFSLASDRND